MKIKKAIKTLYKYELEADKTIVKVSMKDFNDAIAAGRKALMCWLWMCKSVEAGMSDKEIMKVVRKGFLEANDE